MSQPTPYTPTTDFSQQEASNASGRSTVNTAALDAEFANIETSLDQTLSNLQLIQRDDGKLGDVLIEVRCLAPDTLNLMGGFNLTGLWAALTDYAVNDIASSGEYTYVCKTAHTSGAVFETTNWIQFGFTAGADAAQAAAAAQVSASSAATSANTASAQAAAAISAAGSATSAASSATASANSATTSASSASISATNAANSATVASVAVSGMVLTTDLSSTASGKGASVIGRGGQVVASIAALRALLKTSASINSFVTGYYAQGDGGGGAYWYDSTDTTSADNGGTIIVAADGGRWKLTQSLPVSIKQFGAKGDGVTDDTAAFVAAIAASTGVRVPSGTYVVSQVAITKNSFSLIGEGAESTIILGNSPTNDIVLLGDGTAELAGFAMEGITVDSSVVKTAGAAIHARKLVRSSFEDVRCCGQDRYQSAGKKLWNGFWFDSVDYVNLTDWQSVAQNDGLIVNGAATYGAGPQGNLFLSHGKIMVCGAAGIRMAGGFGGLVILATDVIQNNYGLLIDATIVPNTNPNREVFLGPGAFFDGSTNENITVLSDSLQKFTASGAWACTSAAAEGVRIGSMPGQFVWTGGNVKGNARSGFRFDDADTQHMIVGVDIASNGRYGIEWTFPPTTYAAAIAIGNLISNNTLGPTLNLPFAYLGAGSSSSAKLQTQGVTNGDLEIGGAGTGIINYTGTNTSGTATAGGGGTLPATISGYLKIKSNGTELRVPYYNV